MRERIETLAALFEERGRERVARDFPNLTPDKVEIDWGKRYAKIVRVSYGSRSVSAFVDMTTGDIYYPKSWKGPAKGVRGNVNAPDFGLSCFGAYAVRTLR